MESVFALRVQFGFTLMFHYLFVPITIGLSLALVLLEGLHLVTNDPA